MAVPRGVAARTEPGLQAVWHLFLRRCDQLPVFTGKTAFPPQTGEKTAPIPSFNEHAVETVPPPVILPAEPIPNRRSKGLSIAVYPPRIAAPETLC